MPMSSRSTPRRRAPPGCAGGAHRRTTMSPTVTSACRIIPIRPMRTTSGFRPSLQCRSGKSSTSWQLPLAVERVRYVGEAVAMVVAESLVAARDAAEAVAVEYRGASGRDRCRGGARRRRADALAGRAEQSRARQRVRRPRRGRGRDRGCASRGRAGDPQPAHRQRVHGAALGDRHLRRERAAIHPDLGLPGRPSPAQAIWPPVSRRRRSTCARSARTSAAPSDRASISIPSSSRWCGRRAASDAR